MKWKVALLAGALLFSTFVDADADCKYRHKYVGTATIDLNGVISLFLWPIEVGYNGVERLVDASDPLYSKILANVDRKLKVGKFSYIKPSFDKLTERDLTNVPCDPVRPPPSTNSPTQSSPHKL